MPTRWLVVASLGLLTLVGIVAVALRPGDPTGGAGASIGCPRADARRAGPGPQAPAWTCSVVVDSGGGHVGPWRMNRSDWRYVDDPTVALGPAGDAAVAWVDQARKDVFFQRYGPDGEPRLDGPVNVSRSPEVFSWLPRAVVAADDGRRVYLLWQEIVFSGGTHGGEAFFARSTDGGRTFDEPVNLSKTTAGAGKGRMTENRWHNGSLDLALGPEETLFAAWTVYEGGLWLARSRDEGLSFSEPVEVTAGEGDEPARAPSLAVGPNGVLHVVWAVGGDPAADLRHAISPDGGRSVGEPEVLFQGGGHADAPALAADEGGTLHLAWAASPADDVGAHRVRYARSPPDGDGFGRARTVAEPADGLSRVHFPSLDVDGAGDPHIVWERLPEGGGRARGLGYSSSEDAGRTFSEPVVVPDTPDPGFPSNGGLQGLLMRKLAVGASGDVAVVNSSFDPGEASRVRLIRGGPVPDRRAVRPARPGSTARPAVREADRSGRARPCDDTPVRIVEEGEEPDEARCVTPMGSSR